jgi:hypothetical protein
MAGLGNQLFQAAATLAHALAHGSMVLWYLHVNPDSNQIALCMLQDTSQCSRCVLIRPWRGRAPTPPPCCTGCREYRVPCWIGCPPLQKNRLPSAPSLPGGTPSCTGEIVCDGVCGTPSCTGEIVCDGVCSTPSCTGEIVYDGVYSTPSCTDENIHHTSHLDLYQIKNSSQISSC